MPRCNECDESFEDETEARDHVKEKHADACDNWLMEYIEDSINDAYAELIEEDEDEA